MHGTAGKDTQLSNLDPKLSGSTMMQLDNIQEERVEHDTNGEASRGLSRLNSGGSGRGRKADSPPVRWVVVWSGVQNC